MSARMHEFLGIPLDKIAVVPLGINTEGYEGPRPEGTGVFRVGYFARVAPEKGLRELAEAYRVLRQDKGLPKSRLEAAGYLGDEHKGYLAGIERQMRDWGLGDEFRYHGAVDRTQKIEFLRGLDVLSVPGPYPDPKGTYLLEAMAAGTPVVQPRRGAYVRDHRTHRRRPARRADDRRAGRRAADARPTAGPGTHAWAGAAPTASRAHYSVAREADRVLEVFGAGRGGT